MYRLMNKFAPNTVDAAPLLEFGMVRRLAWIRMDDATKLIECTTQNLIMSTVWPEI